MTEDNLISVDEKKPKKYKTVIIAFKGKMSRIEGKVCEGWYDGKHWGSFAILIGLNEKITVTHWQPLPSPPKTKTKTNNL